MIDTKNLSFEDLFNIKIDNELIVKILSNNRICYLLNYLKIRYNLIKIYLPNNNILWGIHSSDSFIKNNIVPLTSDKKIIDVNQKKNFLLNSKIFRTKEDCLNYCINDNLPYQLINSIINYINKKNNENIFCLLEIDKNTENIEMIDEDLNSIEISNRIIEYDIGKYPSNLSINNEYI
tara:strand:- start:587 stop:1120 length:534 start_codon:yes stop_codon:yes gene_type:complete